MIIAFKSLNDYRIEAINSIKSNQVNIQSQNIIYFDSWTSFRGFMSLQKIEILTMISNHKPNSIYELTKWLDRSLSAVQKDCEALQNAGFINLKKKNSGRTQVVPRLKFPYDKILVQIPEHPYELTFKSVA